MDSITVEDESAQGLYNALKNLFESLYIPLNNIIGFRCDNSSTMLGKSGGFQAILKQNVPHWFVLSCLLQLLRCDIFMQSSNYSCNSKTFSRILRRILAEVVSVKKRSE